MFLAWENLCALLALESGVNVIGPNYQVSMDIVEGIRSHKTAIEHGAPTMLLRVLLYHRSSLATDPRDKVYGFLGLCTDDIVQADYRLAPREVYKLLTKKYLLSHYGPKRSRLSRTRLVARLGAKLGGDRRGISPCAAHRAGVGDELQCY